MNKEVQPGLGIQRGGSKQQSVSPLSKVSDCLPDEALARLEATASGLTEEQVERQRALYGANEISHEKPPTWYAQLFHAFLTPFNGVCSRSASSRSSPT